MNMVYAGSRFQSGDAQSVAAVRCEDRHVLCTYHMYTKRYKVGDVLESLQVMHDH